MKTVTSANVAGLADAIYDAFPSVSALDGLLRSDRLGKRFDDLTARAKPLKENCWEVATRAFDEGWALELFTAARELQPDNPKLRALWASLPDLDARVAVDARPRSDRPSLLCGRSSQWNEVCQCAPARQHHIMVVAGGLGQDPLHFRDRINVWLSTDPRRSMVAVHWPTRPVSRDSFFEALAGALNVDPARLPSAVPERLAVQNLILLHDCVTVNFEDPNLIQYYSDWLPELLAGPPTNYKLKCVQPIEWPVESGPRSLWQRLGFDDEHDTRSRDAAVGFITALRGKESTLLPVVDLDELIDLTDEEIRKFLRNSGLTSGQQQRMMDRVLAGPKAPAGIFATIDGYWNQVQTTQ